MDESRTQRWLDEIDADGRRVVVLDDDPTGTQTVSGIPVLLRPDEAAFAEVFAAPGRTVFALTNSRALPRAEAAALVARTVADLTAAWRRVAPPAAPPPAILLRGDSTLRGHVFAETDAVDPTAPVLFVPAFLDGGRRTSGGTHYLHDIPVADTEFATDPVFAYRSSHLPTWVREVTADRRTALPVPPAPEGVVPEAVVAALLAARVGEVVVPDAESEADIAAIAAGLVRAEAAGARVVVRCAASLAAVRGGVRGRRLDHVTVAAPGRVLVVCGSFTAAAGRQVRALGPLWERRVEATSGADPGRLRTDVAERLRTQGSALLATPRRWLDTAAREPAGHGPAAGDALPASAPEQGGGADALMDLLVEVVAGLAGEVDLVVAKGGITSARMARDALGAARADVIGQPTTGVPLWRLHLPTGPVPYLVVPGNVGDDGLLADLLSRIRLTDG